jgi:hypothetical protein
LRSIPDSWRIPPPVGKNYLPRADHFWRFSKVFPGWHGPCLGFSVTPMVGGTRGNGPVRETDMLNFDRFARVATAAAAAFVLSAVSISAASGGTMRPIDFDRTLIASAQAGGVVNG